MRGALIGTIALIMAACASIGRPEGGPRDEVPPVFVSSNPAMGALNVNRNRLDLYFDENISLDDPVNKIVVSPVQKEQARVSANGKHLTVDFRDTLQANTTYTIDFSDAIRDLNESNILDGFAYEFATGDQLDTLSISGMVFEARNLEPAQGMVVGIYSNLADSAISTLQLERIAKTNQYGQFAVRGLKPGVYNIYAINDLNRDWHWDRSENVAFFPQTLSPSAVEVMVTDTLRSSAGEDSLITRRAWEYLPNDVLLTWFNEGYRSQYLRDNTRTTQRTIELKFGAPLDSMPELTIINGQFQGRRLRDLSVLEQRSSRDSMVYWLRDTALINQDSIFVSARYRKTDTLDNLVWQTDTLKFIYKRPKVDKKKKEEKKKKDQEADSTATDSVKISFLAFKSTTGSTQDLNKPLRFEAPEPLLPVSPDVWRLEVQEDTLWYPVEEVKMVPDTASPRALLLYTKWEEGTKYRFTADSAGISNIYGQYIPYTKLEFTTKNADDYGNIYLNITDMAKLGLPDSALVVVELLDKSDKVVDTAPVRNGTAEFHYIEPATYYARAFIDLNADTLWTTGNMALKRLPEDVFYYPKKLLLRKNWDLEQDWSLLDTPVDKQKPNEIKKNKPKTKDPQYNPDDEELDEDEDAPFGDRFGGSNNWGNGSQYNNAGGSGNRRGSTNRRGGLSGQRRL